jgi:hypothetical protein
VGSCSNCSSRVGSVYTPATFSVACDIEKFNAAIRDKKPIIYLIGAEQYSVLSRIDFRNISVLMLNINSKKITEITNNNVVPQIVKYRYDVSTKQWMQSSLIGYRSIDEAQQFIDDCFAVPFRVVCDAEKFTTAIRDKKPVIYIIGAEYCPIVPQINFHKIPVWMIDINDEKIKQITDGEVIIPQIVRYKYDSKIKKWMRSNLIRYQSLKEAQQFIDN